LIAAQDNIRSMPQQARSQDFKTSPAAMALTTRAESGLLPLTMRSAVNGSQAGFAAVVYYFYFGR